MSTFAALRHRDYRLLWFTIMFSSAGQWMEGIALNWLVYDLTGSALMLGAINGVRAIPFLLFGPFAGVAADRMDRKMLMVWGQAYVVVLTTILAIDILAGWVQVWHLFVFMLLSGIGWSVTQPVRQALVPNLVPKEDLMNAIALQSAAFNSTRVVGPAVAGLLVAWVGPGGALMVKSIAYVIIVAMLMMIVVPPLRADFPKETVLKSLIGGFRYIGANRVVFWLIILALIPMLFAMPYFTLMPVFARDVLALGPEGFGLLMSAGGVGSLAATLMVASLGNFQHKGLLLLLSGIGLGVALILFSRSTYLPAALIVLVLVGAFQMTYMALTNTLLQLHITDEVRGRVMSIYMLDQGLAPFGSLWAGTTADLLGAPAAVTIMGVICVALGLTVLSKVPRIRTLA